MRTVVWISLTAIGCAAALPAAAFDPSVPAARDCGRCHTLIAEEAQVLLDALLTEGFHVTAVREGDVRGVWTVAVQKQEQRGIVYVDYGKKKVFTGSLMDVATKTDLSQQYLLDSKLFRSFELMSIKFYEGIDDAIEMRKRRYDTVFSRRATSYIWTELEVRNLLHKASEHRHDVVWKWLNPDGSVLGTQQGKLVVKPDWETAVHASGWGWDNPGQWPAGEYTGIVEIDGIEVGRETFRIAE